MLNLTTASDATVVPLFRSNTANFTVKITIFNRRFRLSRHVNTTTDWSGAVNHHFEFEVEEEAVLSACVLFGTEIRCGQCELMRESCEQHVAENDVAISFQLLRCQQRYGVNPTKRKFRGIRKNQVFIFKIISSICVLEFFGLELLAEMLQNKGELQMF